MVLSSCCRLGLLISFLAFTCKSSVCIFYMSYFPYFIYIPRLSFSLSLFPFHCPLFSTILGIFRSILRVMASDEGMTVALKSSDDVVFYVEKTVAMKSEIFSYMIEDGCADSEIKIPNVNSKILSKVIEYCKKHVAAEEDLKGWDYLKGWDSDFVKVDQATLFGLIEAANYLDIKDLLSLTSHTVADMIKGKSPKEIRKTFNIKNDFTPEEKEEIRRENHWRFDDDENDDLRNFYHTNKANYTRIRRSHRCTHRWPHRRAFEEEDNDGRPSYYYF